MLRFELYEQQRKDEAATSLAAAMLRESLASQVNMPSPQLEPDVPNSSAKGAGMSLDAKFAEVEQSAEVDSTHDPSSQAQDLTSDKEDKVKTEEPEVRRSSRKKGPPGTPNKDAKSATKMPKVAITFECKHFVLQSQSHSLVSRHSHLLGQLVR